MCISCRYSFLTIFFILAFLRIDESEDEIESDKEESDDEGIEDSSNPSSDLSN